MSDKDGLKAYFKKDVFEAGCDEAGRGCLAGPVVAAAVILPKDFHNEILNDSKQLSEKKRNILREIIEREAISWGVAFVDNHEIDQINILNASYLAMHKAIDKLKTIPAHLIIDGNRFKKYHSIPHKCIVKGDSKYLSIAAASILAKTHRDDYMLKLHHEFPNYNWAKNKAYATKKHRAAIAEFGSTVYHRKSFRLIDNQLKFKF